MNRPAYVVSASRRTCAGPAPAFALRAAARLSDRLRSLAITARAAASLAEAQAEADAKRRREARHYARGECWYSCKWGCCVLAIFLAHVACSTGPEEAILSRFFAAARLRDRTALATIAVVGYEPNEQGIVTTFTITSVSPEQRESLVDRRIAELSIESAEPVDLAASDGEMATREVTIAAPVRLPNGDTSQRILVVTLQRAILKGGMEIVGRWVITGIKEIGELVHR